MMVSKEEEDKQFLDGVDGTNNPAVTSAGKTEAPKQRRASTWLRFPALFERSSGKWWNPTFDSDVLEQAYANLSFPRERQRFQYGLVYSIISGFSWSILFGFSKKDTLDHKYLYVGGCIGLIIICIVILIMTFLDIIRRFLTYAAVLLSVILCLFCLLNFASEDGISQVGSFTITVEILLLMYTVFPLPLYICVIVGLVYSCLFEVLFAFLSTPKATEYIGARILLHIAVHLIGIYIFVMTQVRKRSTFLKVGQSIMSRRDLEIEKELKNKMINSLMPEKVARAVIDTDKDNEPNITLAFRKFHMSQMTDVSILFADIVGFTKMSSNKTAERLVSLLNDLFGRFDKLCTETGCEKISTLGDCYYCVSGCPEAKPDHAECCVEMGIRMCEAIQEFDKDHNEEVNMRVGVHTGMVLCGLVGTRRFKFDVWSHDVTIANLMESEGTQGRVHISQATYNFVKDLYELEKGEEIKDIRAKKELIEFYNTETQSYEIKHVQDDMNIMTYFVVSRKENIERPRPDGGDASCKDVIVVNVETETLVVEKEDTPTVVLLGQRDGIGTSLDELGRESDTENLRLRITGTHSSQDHAKMDTEIVQCMRKDSHVEEYLYRPPINFITLHFKSNKVETDYRNHYLTSMTEKSLSLAAPHFSALLDLFVSALYILIVSVCCVLAFHGLTFNDIYVWKIVFPIFVFAAGILVTPLLIYLCCRKSNTACLNTVALFLTKWPIRHIWGPVVASLPVICVFSFISCVILGNLKSLFFYFILIVACLPHFCNFALLNSWAKSFLAAVTGIVCLILVELGICSSDEIKQGVINKETLDLEIILDIALLLLLIFFLNFEAEVSYRLSYHGDVQAEEDKRIVQLEKDRAEFLLHNIIPENVVNILKETREYCKSHDDVGVLFAKISNFEEYYDEGFEGGREYLRVLNEMLGDMEELLNEKRFKDVEKIKTIGACLMVASGLNPDTRGQNRDKDAHLYALVEFAMQLKEKLDEFNKEIFNFAFEMKIGFNYGPVTAGVIGTTKLLYDIWGDTVNVASRMYSTGKAGKIQVTEDCAARLEPMFEFAFRGITFVKGKGDLRTYLLTKKKDGTHWE